MIGSILLVTLPGFALGAACMALANRRASREVARGRWIKITVFGLIVHAVLAAAAVGRPAVVTLIALILAVGTWEFAGAWRRIAAPRPWLAVWLYAGVAVVSLRAAMTLAPEAFAALFLVTAAFDGFSQVVGQWLGRHRLAPRVSPAKTVEGMLGGFVAAGVVAWATRAWLHLGAIDAVLLGIAIGVAGLAGDLGASWLKRRAGLKDYSALLPGQGGVLDRFDSLLGSLTLVGLPFALACACGAACLGVAAC
jgi:phosphatidate cytidylyltransferase